MMVSEIASCVTSWVVEVWTMIILSDTDPFMWQGL